MATSDDIYKEVMIIKGDVQAVKHQTSWMLRSYADSVASHWRDIFGLKERTKRNYNKMRVYLEANGKRTVGEVATAAGVDQADASRWLTEMEKQRIVERLPVVKRRKVYDKTPIDFSLRISEQLKAELAIKDGIAEEQKV